MSQAYKIQEEKTRDGKTSTSIELVPKAQYRNCMKDNIKCYKKTLQ